MNFRKSGLGMMNASLTGMNRIGRVRKFRIQNSKVREDLDNPTPNTLTPNLPPPLQSQQQESALRRGLGVE